jgi:type I restriction enzyme R subunit
MSINFANNNLNGHTNFVEGYNSSKTRICVTVGMMTTGYDCEDILNLCLMRPIFSPTDFIQIKGRGTRKYTFTYRQKDENGEEKLKIDKEKFKLFDFFANCEYFEEKFNYDEILKLPKYYKKPIIDIPLPIKEEDYENYNPDPLKSMLEKEIGPQGMRVDRELFERFEEQVKSNEIVKEKFEMGSIEEAEEYIKNEIFNKPEEYFNLEKLRKAIKLDRRISLREILEKIFGRITKFKNKDELLEEEIGKFILIYKPENKFIHSIRDFIKAYITDMEIRDIMETGEFGRLATNPRFSMEDLKELDGWRTPVIEYIKDYVPLNTFA